LGNLEGVGLPGNLRQMEDSGTGASLFKLTAVKKQGPHDLASEYEVQRACFRA